MLQICFNFIIQEDFEIFWATMMEPAEKRIMIHLPTLSLVRCPKHSQGAQHLWTRWDQNLPRTPISSTLQALGQAASCSKLPSLPSAVIALLGSQARFYHISPSIMKANNPMLKIHLCKLPAQVSIAKNLVNQKKIKILVQNQWKRK